MPESPSVLIVEDEYFLLADLEAALASGGFVSNGVCRGEEAIVLFMESNRNYMALVTNVRLGHGIDGWQVARRVREKEPSLSVICVTGSTAEEWASQGVPSSFLVPKPFYTSQATRRAFRPSRGPITTAHEVGRSAQLFCSEARNGFSAPNLNQFPPPWRTYAAA